MAYKRCPACLNWSYGAGRPQVWVCPTCRLDLADAPAQEQVPPEVRRATVRFANTRTSPLPEFGCLRRRP